MTLSTDAVNATPPARHLAHRAVAWSAAAGIVLLLLKLWVAHRSGSLAVLASAIDGVTDVGVCLVTMWTLRRADRPPDDDHHFGHGKIESVAALGQAAVSVALALWIVMQAIDQLVSHEMSMTVPQTGLALGVLGLATIVDGARAFVLGRLARQFGSHALLAAAADVRGDAWRSGLILATLWAVPLGHAGADPLASLLAALVTLRAAWVLSREALAVLLDQAPVGAAAEVDGAARSVPGVEGVAGVRIRAVGSRLLVEVTIAVDPERRLREVESVRSEVRARLAIRRPDAETLVIAVPVGAG